ncbi:hypothetical protein AgCh_029900 [Apium graveolens]
MWKTEGGVEIKGSSNHFIYFEVENEQVGRWRYTGFYGCPERERRRESWDIIRNLCSRSMLPWCLIGDFNDLIFAEEKQGGRMHPRGLLEGFVDTVNCRGLMNLGFIGTKFTWERSRGQINWVQERLERGLANQDWCNMFPMTEVKVLEVATSDHLPLFLQLNKHVYTPKARQFRFENVWLKEKDCVNVVKNSWDSMEGQGANGELSGGEKLQKITEEENVSLIADIVTEEVKEAVFSMHPEKSPGPDGLNSCFFQVFWSIVGKDVVELCQKFISTGELPGEVNRTLVCLIPKVKRPQTISDLRPISLCNVVVRILSKVLSNRLKLCLKELISDKQSAFMEGRLLNDNALIAFEVNHYMKRRTQGKNGVAGLKIDISKAYDRLEWSYIKNIMRRYEFNEIWVNRIMSFIQSVSYSFLHNGSEFGCVIPQRGLRQDDPISPYIYIMCAEGLSAIVRRNEEAGLLHGVAIARGVPTISHLLFVNDCYFFFKANKAEVGVMKRILTRYENISRQMVNYNKSSVTFSPNTEEETRREGLNLTFKIIRRQRSEILSSCSSSVKHSTGIHQENDVKEEEGGGEN